MIKFLYENDKEWRRLALLICKDKSLADDLTQEMYLKLKDKKELNKSYVYRTLRTLFIDYVRKNKPSVNIDDLQLSYNNDETLNNRLEVLEMLKDCTWLEREVLLLTHEKSLRKCEKETGVSYLVLNYHKRKGLEKLRDKYGKKKL